MKVSLKVAVLVQFGIAIGGAKFNAQDRLAKMPGVEQFRKMPWRWRFRAGRLSSGAN